MGETDQRLLNDGALISTWNKPTLRLLDSSQQILLFVLYLKYRYLKPNQNQSICKKN